MRWSPVTGLSTFRQPSQRTNGHTRDRDGNMISCEHGGRCVSRTYLDGRYEMLVTHWNGKRLNSPNDVVVKSDGTIWFTDPPYGIISDHEGIKADSAIGNNQVYRFDPATGRTRSSLPMTSTGPMASPSRRTSRNSTSRIPAMRAATASASRKAARATSVASRWSTARNSPTAACSPSSNDKVPDGLRVDTEGLLWISAGDGIHCYTPDGERLGRILVPETVANLTFGGFGKSRMFICATSSLYAIETARTGAQWP